MQTMNSTNKELLQKYYSREGIKTDDVKAKIISLQKSLHVRIGVHFFSLDDSGCPNQQAEERAILRALEREYLERNGAKVYEFA